MHGNRQENTEAETEAATTSTQTESQEIKVETCGDWEGHNHMGFFGF